MSNYFIKINKYFDKIFAKLPNWIFSGGVVEHPVTDVTPTMLTPNVISTLRQADHLANQVLNANQESKNNLSQMPLVLIPIHFDRYEYLVNSRLQLSGLNYQGSHQNLQICISFSNSCLSKDQLDYSEKHVFLRILFKRTIFVLYCTF